MYRWGVAAPAAGILCALAQFLSGESAPLDGRAATQAAAPSEPAPSAVADDASAAAGDVAGLTARLGSDAWEERAAAAEALGALGPPARAALPVLVERLRDDSPLVRVRAARSLWEIDWHPASIWTLSELVAHPDPDVRQLAAYSLGQIGPAARGALPELRRQLKSPEAGVRVHAANAALHIDPNEAAAVEALIAALQDGQPEIRMLAALALGNATITHQEAVTTALSGVVTDEDPRVRDAVAASLAAWQESGFALPAVAEPTPTEAPLDTAPQEATAVALADSPASSGHFGEWMPPIKVASEMPATEAPVAAPEPVIVAESDVDEPVAAPLPPADLTGDALPVAGTTPAVEATAPADSAPAADSVPPVADATADEGSEIRLILDQLEGQTPEARRQFVVRLGQMGDQARPMAPVLEALLDDRDPLLRAQAAKTLWDIQHEPGRGVAVLAELLGSTCPGAAPLAAFSLGQMGPAAKAALPALHTALETTGGREHVIVAEALLHIDPNDGAALDALLADLCHADSQVRFQAAYALAECPASAVGRVVPALATALKDSDEQVRMAARLALDAVDPEDGARIVAVNQNMLAPFAPDAAKIREVEENPSGPQGARPRIVFRDVPLRDLRISIAPPLIDTDGTPLKMPRNQAAEELAVPLESAPNGTSRPWMVTSYAWAAPAMLHQPLYYEDTYLDRYGYHFGPIQPIVSGVGFLWTTATLPYQFGAYPIHECRYTLYKYRPGDPVPFQIDFLPFSLKGLLYEATLLTGVGVLAN